MELRAGQRVWLPCVVAPGWFADERFARAIGPLGEWEAIVLDVHLREQIQCGVGAIQAIISEITGDRALLFMPGESAQGNVFVSRLARLMPFRSMRP